jgi:hypothetical protein
LRGSVSPDFRFKRFDIDIDLPKGSHGGLGSYTELLPDGRRLQISEPIMLSWYFILAMALERAGAKSPLQSRRSFDQRLTSRIIEMAVPMSIFGKAS